MNVTKQMHDKKQQMLRRYQRMIKERVVQSGYIQNVGYVNQVSLNVNNIKAKYPVRHIRCDQSKDWQHICGCLEQIEYSTEEVKCNQTSLMNLDELVAAEDHYNIIESMHRSTSQITFFAGEPFIRFWRSDKKLDILNNKKYQQLYIDIKQKSKIFNSQHDFLRRVRQDQRYNKLDQISFNANCIIDFVKLNIPMRFKQCKHLDCFDFTSIIFQLEKINNKSNKQQQKIIKCGMNKFQEDCQSWCYPNYDQLAENLFLDEELQQIIREKHSSCYQIYYNLITNQMMFSCPDEYEEYFDDLVENSICDEIIYKFTTAYMLELNKLQKKIQKQFINIINSRQRDQNFQYYKYQNILFKFKCPLAKQLKQEGDVAMIDYPGRCINCKQIQFADLPNLIQQFYVQMDGQNKIYKCPLCLFNYQSDIHPDQIFRFDEKLKKLMIKFNSNLDEKIQEFYYCGEQKLLKYFRNNQSIEQQQKQNEFSSEEESFRSLDCILSKSRLNNPLKLLDCSNQSRVSFSSFYQKYQNSQYKLDKQNPLYICSCLSCQRGITDLSQLKFDEIFHQILQQIPEEFQQIENHLIIYDYKSKSITQKPYNQKIYNTNNNIAIQQKEVMDKGEKQNIQVTDEINNKKDLK